MKYKLPFRLLKTKWGLEYLRLRRWARNLFLNQPVSVILPTPYLSLSVLDAIRKLIRRNRAKGYTVDLTSWLANMHSCNSLQKIRRYGPWLDEIVELSRKPLKSYKRR